MLPVIETFTEDMKQVNTLLQLATATRNILQKLTIKDIQVVTLPDNYFKFKFVTEDGSTIETNSVFIGESISIDTALSLVSTNPVQNKVITAAINAINDAITALQETALNSAEKNFVSSEYTKTQGTDGAIMHEINVKGNLLWENADPTSIFPAAVITTANFAVYSKLVIKYKFTYGAEWDEKYAIVTAKATGSYFLLHEERNDININVTRLFLLSSQATVIQVFDAFGNEGNTANAYLIPVAIYGIK